MKKKELSRVYYLSKEIKMWEEQLELLECKTRGRALKITGMPFAPRGGAGDEMAEIIADRVDILAIIEKKTRELEVEQKKIIKWIMEIDDTFIRQIMVYRHVRCYTWEQVAKKLDTSAESIRQYHDRFLKKYCE